MASVKTAISLPKPLFEQVERAARDLGISRSQVLSLALQEFFSRRENQLLLERINAVCAEPLDAEEEAQLQSLRQLSQRSLTCEW